MDCHVASLLAMTYDKDPSHCEDERSEDVAIHKNYTDKQMPYYTYILANKPNGTLYVGVTNSLERRVFEHKESIGGDFTTRYKVNMLVYFEEYSSPQEAIAREKQLKAGRRKKKLDLIKEFNPNWRDLATETF